MSVFPYDPTWENPAPESGKFLPVESKILGFGTRNTPRNPQSHLQRSGIQCIEFGIHGAVWNLESKIVMGRPLHNQEKSYEN